MSLAAAALLVVPLSGCSFLGDSTTQPSSTENSAETNLQDVYAAVLAADPRVEDPSAIVSTSGFAKTMSLVVLIKGDEEVSTDTVTAILIAARDATPASIKTITLIAREAIDSELIVDLRPAISGLPDDTTPLWDGGLTMARVDLDKL